jgi:1-acyl-sn-glycerol-3-phosphate acyltransferase
VTRKGNVIIAANHPSLPDDFIVASTLWPHYLLNQRFFIWSVPDERLLRLWKMSPLKRRLLRCIVVNRTDTNISGKGLLLAREVLRNCGVLSLHVEEGRTFGAANKEKKLIEKNGRAIRSVSTRAIKLAAETGAVILPTYIDMPNARDDVSIEETYRRIEGKVDTRYVPIAIYFGEPYKLSSDFNARDNIALERARRDLQERILDA